MADEFQALAFAAREGIDGLAKAQVTQADFLKQFETGTGALGVTRVREAGKKNDGFIHGSIEQITDAETLRRRNLRRDFYFQDVRTIPATAAFRTGDEDIAQELHFDLLET